ncbi:flagellin N-terminal helical domain-containing protein [Paludibacterium paludis]|uniref:Flagellin n=1 Tax=Paludibacterium paludis TaxID=1225769 RepID=A0A918P7I3_9NEIS|nr:flagellin [Paludibacterium paludis]GGY28064.1 flagellin [Paludibacterium paludis]
MAIVVNTNIASLNAQRNLSTSSSSLSTSLQRLSSGLRVNSAKDDAAGLAISQTLTSAVRGNNQGIRNANDGISVAQTAEGAMGQVGNNLQRIREIAVQAANGSVSDTNRSQLQKEVDQLTQEISRIVQTTNFNGTKLLTSGQSITFQVGASGTADNQVVASGVELSGLKAYNQGLSAVATVNVMTSGSASAALSDMDSDISKVSDNRAQLGALQNRFEAVVANMQNYVENLTASNSRIMDTDFASETANLTRNQILQQAGTSILGQANQLPQAALNLLRG